jgi:NADPH-dependent 7-cyano-7-deazaguanine reductase QueF-like protein
MYALNKSFYVLLSGLLIAGLFTLSSCQKEGCTDENAINFDPEAQKDDGTCIYPPGGGGAAGASDTIESNITSNRTITENTYICGGISIEADVEVMAGVTITMCAGASIDVTSSGSLHLAGSSSNPVIVTGEVKTAGYWNYIHVNSNNPNNHFEHAELRYGGGDDWYNHAMVWVQNSNNAQLTVNNTTFSNSKGYGLYAESSTELPSFSSNTFAENQTVGLSIASEHLGFLDADTDYDDDNSEGEPYIHVRGNTITKDQTWVNTNASYLFKEKTKIDAGVTVNEGTTILMDANAWFDVQANGYFKAVGTSSNKITIEGEEKTHGYWGLIHVNSNNSNNQLKHVNLAYGGGDDWYNYSMVWLQNSNNSQLTMESCSVSNSSGWGLYVESSTNMTPSDSASVVDQNSFSSNGQSNSSSCTGNCDVYFE